MAVSLSDNFAEQLSCCCFPLLYKPENAINARIGHKVTISSPNSRLSPNKAVAYQGLPVQTCLLKDTEEYSNYKTSRFQTKLTNYFSVQTYTIWLRNIELPHKGPFIPPLLTLGQLLTQFFGRVLWKSGWTQWFLLLTINFSDW